MDDRLAPEKLLILVFIVVVLTSLSGAVESITGRREACSNEGEEVKLDAIRDFRCFRCICQNGFVECEQENCPPVHDCYMLEKRPTGSCCEKCKECDYKGYRYTSGAEWTDPDDPCISFKCVAGVITETTAQCYTPCSDPLPPRPGQCCPTCLGCYINGQNVLDGREVTLTEDPCLRCHCSNKRLTCIKKACPVLQCPVSKQVKYPGDCCPRCSERREIMQVPGKCILGKGFHSDGKRFSPDHCSTCTCANGTSICQRNTCPVLECAPEYQKTHPGDCCPHCPPIAEARSTCMYEDKVYQNNETWNLDPCRSCRCHGGEIRCAQMKCPKAKCRPNETLVTPPDQCCSKCVESAGICTVFGDPHYKTFDGKFFSFQGSCKYQLASDCRDHTFSIRVTNDGRNTKMSSWTKTVTLKIAGVKVNLGQKLRVKVNGTKVTLPYNTSLVDITKSEEGAILLKTTLGIQLEWDGSNFLQVQVPTTYKNKLCGLCGNYNGISRDDLTSRDGVDHSEHVFGFANSWKVGGPKSCTRKHENLARRRNCKHRKTFAMCQKLQEPDIFGECSSRLNPHNYFESCKTDMCECLSGMCYCESFAAYAHECQRLGVTLPDWREMTYCPHGLITHPHQIHPYTNRLSTNQLPLGIPRHHEQQQQRQRKKNRNRAYISKHVPKALLIRKPPGRTPPPLH